MPCKTPHLRKDDMSTGSELTNETDGQRIVDAIAAGSTDKLQAAVNGLKPEELQQLYVEIDKANAERQADGLPAITVIVADQDHDGRVDVSGTNTQNGLTIGAEGKDVWGVKIDEYHSNKQETSPQQPKPAG